MKKRLNTILSICLFASFAAFGQSVGDTIVVSTLNYGSTVRDTVVQFPTDTNLTFEKVIMLYSMRCKNGLVSTSSDRNKGCGEWDYSCNTYVHDSAHVDSLNAIQPSYVISGFSGTSYAYKSQATNSYYQQYQKSVALNAVVTEDTAIVGAGTDAVKNGIQSSMKAGKTQYLFTQTELAAAGLTAGSIDGLDLFVQSAPANAKSFRVRLKETTSTSLSASTPENTGFSEVYYYNNAFVLGANRIQFYTPFNWNGTSNIIVELSFTNSAASPDITFAGDSINSGVAVKTAGEIAHTFNTANYIEADNYYGITGSGTRTVEAWIKTTATGKEIVSWGTNAANQKYVIRLDGSGKLRLEINGGWAVATSALNDGKWHHIAVSQTSGSMSSVAFYVDGVLENKTALQNKTINTQQGIKVRISKGHHNLYWNGEIDEVRIWNTSLTQVEVQEYMYKPVDAAHPEYANLELYYQFNEGTGSTINDASGNARNATVMNNPVWTPFTGVKHFYGWQDDYNRPNMAFYQGTYNLTVGTDTIIDTIANEPNLVKEYQVYTKPGTIYSDSLGIVMQGNYWEALPESVYDTAGNVVATIPVSADGTFNIVDLPYTNRWPSKFEIMSFVTPYGIGLDLGLDGETWAFDVTDFTPILNGKKRITMERGGQWQEQMDIKFLFIVGTPPREVKDIQQIWRVDSRNYTQINTDAAFEPRDVMMDASSSMFKIRSSITGHGQEGEFIARQHHMTINGGAPDFTWQVWKSCELNPVYPQGGTWVYDRAGWCPGMATDIKELDITNLVVPGQTANIDYGMAAATGDSRYIVSNQLVTYGAPNFTLDAAVADVITPSSKIEFARTGTLCEGPVVKIQNTGSDILTTLEISYWVNNASSPQTFSWTGHLGFLETEEVQLPVQNLWDDLNGSNNVFYVEVSMPNGGTDGYSYNNKNYTSFEIPNVVPNDIYVWFKTNNAGYENSYEVLDENGNTVFTRPAMGNNTFYNDTLNLTDGCYTLRVYDSGGDGVAWWANNDGTGFVQLRNATTNGHLKTFEPDFGGEILYSFTVNSPLAFEEINPAKELVLYPNPAAGRVTVEMENLESATVIIYNNTGQQFDLSKTSNRNSTTFNTSVLSSGVYYIKVELEGEVLVKKLVIL